MCVFDFVELAAADDFEVCLVEIVVDAADAAQEFVVGGRGAFCEEFFRHVVLCDLSSDIVVVL